MNWTAEKEMARSAVEPQRAEALALLGAEFKKIGSGVWEDIAPKLAAAAPILRDVLAPFDVRMINAEHPDSALYRCFCELQAALVAYHRSVYEPGQRWQTRALPEPNGRETRWLDGAINSVDDFVPGYQYRRIVGDTP